MTNDRGDLVANGFADARGHQNEGIFSIDYFLDNFELVFAECIISEVFFQDLLRLHMSLWINCLILFV
jgi:hypothetical protein